jgi:predicted nucleotidyltransferase
VLTITNNAIEHTIDNICTIKILSAPYFLATKLEAFKGRGKDNGIQSHDFEDIVFVLENRYSIWTELSQTNENVKKYLQSEFALLLERSDFFEWIDSNVERMSPPASYFIYEQLQKFVDE